jgi:ANTAR domain
MVGPPENRHMSSRVHQATGMIAAQIPCDTGEAFDRLKLRSAAQGQSLDETALDVLDGVIRFDE